MNAPTQAVRILGDNPSRPITIAILAMDGQDGGVLVDWIVDLAEHNGYLAQAMSVAGVAQRTGATIYYIELFAQRHVSAHGGAPVLALMPVPGEVDIVIASELMEAGRAMQRGLVTPERTTLITSSHRDYATQENVVPGNGIADTAAALHTHALACGGAAHGHAATVEAARWVAVAMAYDDVIRVADLKTRAERSQRVREEVGAGADAVVGTVEFFHPRLEEVYAMLPGGLVRWIEGTPLVRGLLAQRVGKGQRLRPHTIRGQLLLQGLAALRRWRRRSQRQGAEMAHIDRWLAQVKALMQDDYRLGLELITCRRLVKGYSDTHARGSSKFDRLLRAARLLKGRPDAAADLAALRKAALADPQGTQLTQRWELLGLPE